MKRYLFPLIALALFTLVGCHDEPCPPEKVGAVELTVLPEEIHLAVGDTHPLILTVTPENRRGEVVITSSHPAIAQVKDEVVVAVSPGEALLTVKLADVSRTVKVTVTEAINPETGLFMPMTEFGASLEKVRLYEKSKGRLPNLERTNPSKGFYAFDTKDPDFPMVGYWMDEKTGKTLEESAIYAADKETLAGEAPEFLERNGYVKTPMKDAEGNEIYYIEAAHRVALLITNNKLNAFRIQFFIKDYTDELPAKSVKMVFPSYRYGKTLEEILEWEKARGHAAGIEQHPDLGKILRVKTDSKDFPEIYYFPENDLYAGSCVMAEGFRQTKSPHLREILKENGYVYDKDPNPAMENWINRPLNTSAQIVKGGDGTMFPPSIGFETIQAVVKGGPAPYGDPDEYFLPLMDFKVAREADILAFEKAAGRSPNPKNVPGFWRFFTEKTIFPEIGYMGGFDGTLDEAVLKVHDEKYLHSPYVIEWIESLGYRYTHTDKDGDRYYLNAEKQIECVFFYKDPDLLGIHFWKYKSEI